MSLVGNELFTNTNSSGVTQWILPHLSSIYFNTGGAVSANNFIGAYGQSATLANNQTVVPQAGTIANLYVSLLNAPGGANTRTLTVIKNGVATALTVTLTGASVSGSDTTHSFTVVAGDLLTVQNTISGAASSTVTCSVTFSR